MTQQNSPQLGHMQNTITQSLKAASTDVEWVFSHGGLTVSKMCHHLSDRSVRSATVLGSWVSLPGLILKNEIIKLFKNKSKRPKGKGCHDDNDGVICIE
jgi:hypothetical protein